MQGDIILQALPTNAVASIAANQSSVILVPAFNCLPRGTSGPYRRIQGSIICDQNPSGAAWQVQWSTDNGVTWRGGQSGPFAFFAAVDIPICAPLCRIVMNTGAVAFTSPIATSMYLVS